MRTLPAPAAELRWSGPPRGHVPSACAEAVQSTVEQGRPVGLKLFGILTVSGDGLSRRQGVDPVDTIE